MPCLLSKDQDLRIKLSPNGVVHAGHYAKLRATTRIYLNELHDRREEKIPERTVIRMACSWKDVSPDKLCVSNKERITCKNCMKAMGMVEGPVFPERFVIFNKKTGQYLKNTSSRCTTWSDHVVDAWFWKRRGDAERRCKTGGWWIGDKKVKYGHKTEDGVKPEYRRVRNPDLVIKKVKITVED